MSVLDRFSKENKLWDWFLNHASEFINAGPDSPVYTEFHEKLKGINPSLVFEISAVKKSGLRTVTISCDGRKEGVPAVEKLVEKAPTMKEWNVEAFRQPVRSVLTLEMGEVKLSTDDVLFDYQVAPGNTLDVVLYVDDIDKNNKDNYLQGALILLDAAIGEYDAMTKIRHLDLEQTPKNIKSLKPLTELKSVF